MTIAERFSQLVAAHLEVPLGRVTPDADFILDLKADSFAVVELILATELEFNFQIPDDDVETISTVAQAIAYVERHAEKGR